MGVPERQRKTGELFALNASKPQAGRHDICGFGIDFTTFGRIPRTIWHSRVKQGPEGLQQSWTLANLETPEWPLKIDGFGQLSEEYVYLIPQ